MNDWEIKLGDLVISKNDWEKDLIGYVIKVEARNGGGFDNLFVRWSNGRTDIYYYWMLQVINECR